MIEDFHRTPEEINALRVAAYVRRLCATGPVCDCLGDLSEVL